MIVTKEHQEAMVEKYRKERHNQDECTGFIDGLNTTLDLVKNLTIPDASKSYCGEVGDDNIKADLREIYDACGYEQEFTRLYNEMKLEKDEQDFESYMEDKVSNL